MKVDLIYSGPSPLEEKRTSGPEKCRECGAPGNPEFSKILETMLKEISDLKSTTGNRHKEGKQELRQFIQSVEKADKKFQTAMFLRKALLDAYRNVAGSSAR